MNSVLSHNTNLHLNNGFYPKVSIITVVYNGAETLERTIKSIAALDYRNLEYIIVDGKSSDDTIEIIRKYEYATSLWISEPDEGLYDAMNKGMSLASGDYLWFINSGDEVSDPQVLSQIFQNFPRADIYYGETMIVDYFGHEIGLRRLRPKKKLKFRDFLNGMLVSHQSVIVSRRVASNYNIRYRLSADFDWVVFAFKSAGVAVNTGMILSRFLEGGLTRQNIFPGLKERFIIMTHYFGFLPALLHHIPISLRFIYYYVKHKRF
ncbi:glycosyltransferase family 2 protein [Alkalitalea saponilacus]|uniref:Glycosyltransferase involved in cell wall bisynthesis n=1 Tax=Alkalitalea saponilacus TaxID=889453 RepID=A0A1T5E572_9BACT|nr:glycosyltransferase family 2 protein [Alkalitalea saponilacus]ASB49106.1 glycosyl transferase [Alkalitalea saponilacus]SKB79005.1 Glycosyltransferase involved in cell wall bisynthesis [Alkalitalea saponilacus]